MALQVQLENFTGPLDLLLHLIKSHEMDICDIRIFEITEQYLAIIDQMKQLDLEVAGEFLLMAATLVYIKSRMLLPVGEDSEDEEAEDPRAELVKRLLDYQRYKEAGQRFDQLSLLERDVFLPRPANEDINLSATDLDQEVTASIFQLAHLFHRLLQNVQPETFHEVIREEFSVAESIETVRKKFINQGRLAFREVLYPAVSRAELIVTFLAILELIRMRMLRVEQVTAFSDIWLTRVASREQMAAVDVGEEVLGYG